MPRQLPWGCTESARERTLEDGNEAEVLVGRPVNVVGATVGIIHAVTRARGDGTLDQEGKQHPEAPEPIGPLSSHGGFGEEHVWVDVTTAAIASRPGQRPGMDYVLGAYSKVVPVTGEEDGSPPRSILTRLRTRAL